MRWPLDPELMVPAHFTVESAEASVDALLARGVQFDGIVAASDLIALGRDPRRCTTTISRCRSDVSVVGYDDVPFARYSRPALTTVKQDTARAGRLLVSKLLDAGAATDMRSERLPTDLIVARPAGVTSSRRKPGPGRRRTNSIRSWVPASPE